RWTPGEPRSVTSYRRCIKPSAFGVLDPAAHAPRARAARANVLTMQREKARRACDESAPSTSSQNLSEGRRIDALTFRAREVLEDVLHELARDGFAVRSRDAADVHHRHRHHR